MTKHERIDLYQDVTNRIVEQLENGVAPWVQPWSSTASGPSLPLNVALLHNSVYWRDEAVIEFSVTRLAS